jgi:hypothetical protein
MPGAPGAASGGELRAPRSLATGRTDRLIPDLRLARLTLTGSKPRPLSSTSSRQRLLPTRATSS